LWRQDVSEKFCFRNKEFLQRSVSLCNVIGELLPPALIGRRKGQESWRIRGSVPRAALPLCGAIQSLCRREIPGFGEASDHDFE
jgi:hypothetical protein